MSFVLDLASLLGLLAVVVGTVWFVVRWKWQEMVARNQEMRRRMAFAAAEASKAELEAAVSYHSVRSSEPVVEEPVLFTALSPGRQVQYICEVCGTPTTTRCKQCKSVHYCSGKCQIVHWRQGHKEECSILSAQQKSDVGSRSSFYEFNHDTEFNGLKTAEPVGVSYISDSIAQGFKENKGAGMGTIDANRAYMDAKVSFDSLSDVSAQSTAPSPAHESSNRFEESNGTARGSVSMNLEAEKLIPSERLSPTNPGNCNFSTTSDEKSLSSVSSECSLTGSEDHSLSEPSTPSCSFWDESDDHKNSKIDAVDKFDNTNVKKLDSIRNRVIADGPCLSTVSKCVAPYLEANGSDFDLRLRPLSSKLSSQNSQASNSLHFSSNEKARVLSSRVIENIYKEQKPTVHTLECRSQQKPTLQYLPGHENEKDRLTLEATKCQGNKLELSKSSLFANSSSLSLSSGENGKSCMNDTCLLDQCENPETDASRIGYLNRGIMSQLRASDNIKWDSLCSGEGVMGTYKGSFSYEHFVKLYNWNEVELCPCGLVNCGNSCYINAVLQCLVFTPPLTAYFLQGIHSKNCQKKEWCFSCEFEDLVKKVRAGRYPVSPIRIMSKIDSIGSHLVHGREEDAHEFLRYAIDSMQLACLREAGAKVPTPVDEETTLLSFTFGGYLRSKIECMRCGCISEQHERMMDLAVEIGGDVSTLEDALFQFTHTEILDGENKYLCSRCKSYEKAKKKLRVLEAPNILTIALKRFQGGSKYGKLNKRVEFSEILDLAPYMSGTSDVSPIYRLYGVVVHVDFGRSGHYLCYVQNNRRKWFEANDRMVEEVKLEKVLSKDAYMLFYTRCSPRSPRLVRSLVLQRDPKKAKNSGSSHPLDPWNVSSGGYFSKRNTSSAASDESSSEYSSSFFSDVG